jgi:rhodanese-related sulfurtransferase
MTTPCTPATAIAVSINSLLIDSCGPRPAKISRSASLQSPLPSASASSPLKLLQRAKSAALITPAKVLQESQSFALSPPSSPKLPKTVLSLEKANTAPLDNFAESLQIADLEGKENTIESLLPTIDCQSSGSCSRISVQTLADALNGKMKPRLQKCVVIDCRFDYEHKGGHIIDAVNTTNKEHIRSLFNELRSSCEAKSTAIVFHCEYSKHRAPKMSGFWRQLDREVSQYPKLVFPHVYILDGGYKEFFRQFPDFCEPKEYVSMFHESFQEECKNETKRFRGMWQSRRARSKSIDEDSKPACLQVHHFC